MNIYKYDPGKHSFKNIEVSSVQETYWILERFIITYHCKDLSDKKIFIYAFRHMIVYLSFPQNFYCDIITQ